MNQNFGSSEILLIAEAVAREKNISKDSVIEALEDAIRVAARRKYGHESTIRAEIDRKSGDVKIFREMIVVPNDYVPAEEVEIGKENADEGMRSQPDINPILLSDA